MRLGWRWYRQIEEMGKRRGERVREDDPCSKTGEVSFCWLYHVIHSDRWHEIWSGDGTTLALFVDIIRRIIADIGTGTSICRHCFTFDNLSFHLHPPVFALIYETGHRVIARAPYWPVDGAIEYVFNTPQVLLYANVRDIKEHDDLVNHIKNIIANFGTFTEYFRHVSFIS